MANVKVAIRLFVYKDIKYMGTIAKGEITLSTVNDAYTVSLSNPVCAIHADFDGSHPQLDNATTLVTVKRGDKPVKFKISNGMVSDSGVENFRATRIDDYQYRLTWLAVNSNALEGFCKIEIRTLDGFDYSTVMEWKYSILRESTMLDWIQDWEGGKTKIGSAYIMTPKMFIGKKDDYGQYVGQVDDIAAIPGLTGVYIGPDNLSAGIYGYKDSVEIFHLNEEGGKIGGWDINSDTISCGNLWLDSHGSILARNDEGDKIWWLKENGYAEFAFGNVKFYANGNAEYTGEITATGGTIGGWSIHNNQLESPAGCTFIDGIAGALGICAGIRVQDAVTGRTLIEQSVRGTGGVAMFYNSANSFGLIGYVPSGASAKQVFAVGSTNYIAGWNFTTDSLYLGANKNNTKRKYTSASGEITLGTNGIRGNAWYLDNDGVASFAGDKIHFEADSGTIVGWKVNNNRLSTNNVALVSVDGYYGLYLTQASNAGFNSWAASALSTHIEGNGGIYIQTNNSRAVLAAYNTSGQKLFGLFSNGTSTIAGWKFNNDSLFTGNTAVTNAASYAASGCISFGPTGIFGSKWKLLNDGSGSLANGKIAWAADGTITFDAPVSANNITAGTISTADIQNQSGSWFLKQDGSGALANGNVRWDKDGNTEVLGSFSQQLHYAYKSDMIILDANGNSHAPEPLVTAKINKHLYLATNVYENGDMVYDGNDRLVWNFELYWRNYYNIILPNDATYIGKEVKIYDCNYGPFTRQPSGWCTTTISGEAGGFYIATKLTYDDSYTKSNIFQSITIRGGYVSLVAVPDYDIHTGQLLARWVCTDMHGALCTVKDLRGNEYDCNNA